MLAMAPIPQRPSGCDRSSCEQANQDPTLTQPGGRTEAPWCDSEKGRSLVSFQKDVVKDNPARVLLAGKLRPPWLCGEPCPTPPAPSNPPLPPSSTDLAASLPHPGARAACFYSFSLSRA